MNSSVGVGLEAFGAMPESWQTQWQEFNQRYTPLQIYFVGMHAVSAGMFWGLSFLYLLIDLYRPSFLAKYKIQETVNVPLDMNKFWGTFRRVLFNQVCINFPLSVIAFYGSTYRGYRVDTPLPSVLEIFVHLVIIVILQDISFYYTHRLAHIVWYKHVHKIHHEWTAPIGLAAQYAHPLEQFICNLLPVMLGPLLLGSHVVTLWIWLAIALFDTVTRHSGYHLPVMPSPEFHDFHHKIFNGNYGNPTGVLDRLHGTDSQWQQSLQQKHDRIFYETATVKEIVSREMVAEAAAKQKKGF